MKKLIMICLLITAQIGYGAAGDPATHRMNAMNIGIYLGKGARYGKINGIDLANLLKTYLEGRRNDDRKAYMLAEEALKSIDVPFNKVYFNETGHGAVREMSEPATHLFDAYYDMHYKGER